MLVEAHFPPGAQVALAAHLQAHPGEACALLANLADESFAAEDLPHVRGPGGKAMVARKRVRHAHGSPFCAALRQGRRTEGRRDDRYLFATLARAAIEPWLQAIERCGALLSGIHSLPQLAAQLVAANGPSPAVLVSCSRAGLRQTFVTDGHLRFSRLTPLADATPEETAAACAAEAATMLRYLCAQRMTKRDVPLTILILADPAQRPAFAHHCRDDAGLRFQYLDLAAEVRRRSLRAMPVENGADPLFAWMLARKPPPAQFAPASARHRWQLARAGRAVERAGLAACVAGLLFAGVQVSQAFSRQASADQLASRNAQDEAALRVAPGPVWNPALQVLMHAHEELLRASPGPLPLLVRLSRALDDVAAIELERLEWRLAGEFDGAQGHFAVLDVHGSFAAGADPRSQQRAAEQLAAGVAGDSIRVLMVKAPLGAESRGTLRSADLVEPRSFLLRMGERL